MKIKDTKPTALALAKQAGLYIATYNPGDGTRIKVMAEDVDYHAADGLCRADAWVKVVIYLRGYLDGRAAARG